MNMGVGLVILAVIFAVGVVAFALLAITVLPATMLAESRIDAMLRNRATARAGAPPEDETAQRP